MFVFSVLLSYSHLITCVQYVSCIDNRVRNFTRPIIVKMTVGQVEYLQDLSDGRLRISDFHISCIGFIYYRQVNGTFGQVIFTIHLPDGQEHWIWNFEACKYLSCIDKLQVTEHAGVWVWQVGNPYGPFESAWWWCGSQKLVINFIWMIQEVHCWSSNRGLVRLCCEIARLWPRHSTLRMRTEK